MSDEREHSELSLSSSDIWINCPGSIFLKRTLPELPAGPDAKRGTHVHSLCDVTVADFLNYKLSGTDPNIRAELIKPQYTAEEIANAQGYLDAIWKEVLNQSITNKAWGTEEKFTIDETLDIYGTVDFWCIYIDDRAKRVADIVDYKNGYKYVSEKSGQLKSYGVAVRAEIRRSDKDVDYVRASIYQPNCASEKPFRSAVFTTKQLDTWEKKVYKAAHQIYVKKKPKFKVGSWCEWCPAKKAGICKAYLKDIEARTALRVVEPQSVVLPKPETLPPEHLVNIILHGKVLTDYVKECVKYGLNLQLASGKLSPWLKAVLKEGRRRWKKTNTDEIVKFLKESGVKEADIFKTPDLQPITSIEKKIGKNKLGEYTEKNKKPILVPLDDERLEIKNGLDLLSAIEDVDDVESET